MKLYPWFSTKKASGRGPSSIAGLALLLAGAGWLCAFDNNSGSNPGDGNYASGGGGGDDETVGTLPSHAGEGGLDFSRYRRITQPCVYLEGPAADVLHSALAARGDRRAFVQPLSGGELRLVFPGAVEVVLERGVVQASGLRFGVATPAGASVLRAGASWNGQALPWDYVYELPVGALDSAGLLDIGPIHAGVTTSAGRSRVHVQAKAEAILLTQRR